MEMPKPTAEHEKLHRFAGEWSGDETLAPSPWGPGGRAVGRYAGRVLCDGFFVAQEYEEEKDGHVVYRGHGVFGWDEREKCVGWFWVDSMGGMPAQPSRGRWEGDTLVLTSQQGDMMGRYTFAFDGAARYRFRLENSRDGGKTWALFVEGDYRKK